MNTAEMVCGFVTALYSPTDIIEVRLIWPDRSAKAGAQSQWSPANVLCGDQWVEWLSASNRNGWGIFVGANPRNQIGGRDSSSVSMAKCLFVDFDRGETIDSALIQIDNAHLPFPTALIASGHGVHAYWRLDSPMADLGQWTLRQRALIALFPNADRSIHDPPRVMRVPGFLNTKQPTAPCVLIDANPARIYSLESFPHPTSAPSQTTHYQEGTSTRNIPSRMTVDFILNGADEGGRNNRIFGAAADLSGCGYTREEVETKLIPVAVACGTPEQEARAAIGSAFAKPRTPSVPNAGTSAPPTPAFVPFPLEALPDPVRGFIAAAAKAMGCDPSYLALPMLSALASAIGNTWRVLLKNSWTEPAIVWTAIIGESGTMKTPAFKAVMRPLRRIETAAFKAHQGEIERWKTIRLKYEADLAAWKRTAASGEGVAKDPPREPECPLARRYIVSDTTTEALAPILSANPRGVLMARDELSGWLGSFDRYSKSGKGGADSAHWLSMHNGEALTIDRKTGNPPTIHVPFASVSVTGGIQPGILRRAMGPEHHESGMLARLLFAMPPRHAKRWSEADVEPAIEMAIATVFERLLSLKSSVDLSGDRNPCLIRLDAEAARSWITFYNDHATEQAGLSEELSAAWSKLEGYAARFALIVHFTRWASGDSTLLNASAVDARSVGAGVSLAQWFGAEARRVYAILDESEGERECRKLVDWIRSKGGTVTPRDLMRSGPCFQTAREAELALDGLVKTEQGFWEYLPSGPTGGAPSKAFRLLQRPDADSTTVHPIAAEGSVSVSIGLATQAHSAAPTALASGTIAIADRNLMTNDVAR